MEFTLDYLVKDAILWGVFIVFTDCWVFGLPRVGLAGLDRQNVRRVILEEPMDRLVTLVRIRIKI
jgi:hypothetical protein